MSFSTRDLEEAIVSQFGRYAWSELSSYDGDNLTVNGEDYKFEYVDADYGDYDSSSRLWVVFKVDGQAFRKTGYYQSHYGSEWDGYVEKVEPKEVTRIEWDSV